MTSPPPLGAISSGIRYQVRFFWRHALPMLYPTPVVRKVVLEHREVDAVDDVVVYYVLPGINERGSRVAVDFHQLKYHVAQTGAVDHESVVDPAWTGTRLCMLKRLADAWLEVTKQEPRARLSLVTNWAWDPRSPVARLLRDGGWLSDEFLSKGDGTEIGNIRQRWRDATGLSATDFPGFVRTLRFSTSAVSLDDAEMWLNDRCQLAGLVPVGVGIDHSPYDDLGARFIESGRTEHSPESLSAIVREQGLVATKRLPYRSTYAVRSFSRFVHAPETDGACVVDLTDLFEERHVRSGTSWITNIPKRLKESLAPLGSLEAPIHLALDTHLSIAWYVGTLLDAKFDKPLLLRQRVKGKGVELWDISVPRMPEGGATWRILSSETAHKGSEMAVVVSVTHSALADATRHIKDSLPDVVHVVNAELSQLGPQALVDGGHARWLADDLIRALGSKVAELRPKRLHIFPACPASLMFLLGQESRVLGATTLYEFDFGSPERRYNAGVSTGAER